MMSFVLVIVQIIQISQHPTCNTCILHTYAML